MVAVVSACYGQYDEPPEINVIRHTAADWVIVTDDPELVAPDWRVVYEPRPHLHPNVAAKYPKLFPGKYTDERETVWVDCSSIIGPNLIDRAINAARRSDWGWAQLPHAHRSDLVEEVTCSRTMAKYDGQDLENQVAHYLRRAMPRSWGLWATGLIARSPKDDSGLHEEMGAKWLCEINRWSFQDQLSHSFVMWAYNLRPEPIAPDHCSIPSEIWWRGHKK